MKVEEVTGVMMLGEPLEDSGRWEGCLACATDCLGVGSEGWGCP